MSPIILLSTLSSSLLSHHTLFYYSISKLGDSIPRHEQHNILGAHDFGQAALYERLFYWFCLFSRFGCYVLSKPVGQLAV